MLRYLKKLSISIIFFYTLNKINKNKAKNLRDEMKTSINYLQIKLSKLREKISLNLDNLFWENN